MRKKRNKSLKKLTCAKDRKVSFQDMLALYFVHTRKSSVTIPEIAKISNRMIKPLEKKWGTGVSVSTRPASINRFKIKEANWFDWSENDTVITSKVSAERLTQYFLANINPDVFGAFQNALK